MARHLDVHPADPQPRLIAKIADIVRSGGVIAYPTDSCYALGCQLGNSEGIARIRTIRQLDERHHLTLVCRDFAQLGQYARVDNHVFRAVKAATPGSYTFILPATREVPRKLQHPGKKTIGVRIPRHRVTRGRRAGRGAPLVSTTLLLPGQDEPMTQGWEIADQLGDAVDAVIDSGDCGLEPTTIIDLSQDKPEILRRGAGDTSGFE
jgi:tRNA threonylcarbamoyl adenosine modification protein (Sua5/YciO/YrdC/YwlC family)